MNELERTFRDLEWELSFQAKVIASMVCNGFAFETIKESAAEWKVLRAKRDEAFEVWAKSKQEKVA